MGQGRGRSCPILASQAEFDGDCRAAPANCVIAWEDRVELSQRSPIFGKTILTTPSLNMADPAAKWPDHTFTTRDYALVTFDAAASDCRAALAACTDAQLAEPWKFSFGDHVISSSPRSLAYRHMCFNHLIHHRAQLGVYLRLNNIPVPALYGPSADEQWAPK